MAPRLSLPSRALAAGALCLAILGGMIVGHAWPLWTGRTVTLKVMPVDPRDLFRGEYVRLRTSANMLYRAGSATAPVNGAVVQPIGIAFEDVKPGSVIYVQLQASPSGDYVPVSFSSAPVADALNLRGRAGRFVTRDTIGADFGLDAYYMHEGEALNVERAVRDGRNVQIEVAIAASGQARIRRLLVDGVPAGRQP